MHEGLFRTTFNVDPAVGARLSGVGARAGGVAADRVPRSSRGTDGGFSTLKVSHASGKPILFLPPEPERSDLPKGGPTCRSRVEPYSANFVKVAVNVVRQARRRGERAAQNPPRLVRSGRGRAGHAACRRARAARDRLASRRPLGRRRGELQLWRATREKRSRRCSGSSSRPRSGTPAS